jgi:hypothetical protein
MRLTPMFAIFTAVLAACGPMELPGVRSGVAQSPGKLSSIVGHSFDPSCALYEEPLIKQRGGTERIAPLLGTMDFYGKFQYARLSKHLDSAAVVFACPDNAFGIRVPVGYSADWYGAWRIGGLPGVLTFESGDLVGFFFSSSLSPSLSYSLDVFSPDGFFMESEPLTFHQSRQGPYYEFSSPFANGFQWPSWRLTQSRPLQVNLAIVHASQ